MAAKNPFGLSPRELEIVKLRASGMLLKQIGPALGIAFDTVKTHVARIAKKTGTHSGIAATNAVRDWEQGEAVRSLIECLRIVEARDRLIRLKIAVALAALNARPQDRDRAKGEGAPP